MIEINLVEVSILQIWQSIKKKWFYLTNGFFRTKEPDFVCVSHANSLIKRLSAFFVQTQQKKVLLICPQELTELDFFKILKEQFIIADISLFLHDNVVENPTITLVEQCVHKFFSNQCQSILVIGGGSAIDLAKASKARILNPEKSIHKLQGLANVKNRQLEPLLIACPTTFTTSQTNYSSYILDHTNQAKYALIDRVLLPNFVFHCTELINAQSMSTYIGTACSVLSDALETLLSKKASPKTKRKAADISKVFIEVLQSPSLFKIRTPRDLENTYDLSANLQKSAHLAGSLSKRTLTGYARAMNHALAVYYNLNNKDICHLTLLAILSVYEKTIPEKLNSLGFLISLDDLKNDLKEISEKWNLSIHLPQVKLADYPLIKEYVKKQVNDLYSPPCFLSDDLLIEAIDYISL